MTNFQSARDWLLQALDHVPKPLFFVDLDAKKVWFSNQAAQRMLGLKYEDGWAYDKSSDRLKLFDKDGNEVSLENYPSRRALRGESLHGEEVILETPNGRFFLRVFINQMPAIHEQPRSAVILLQDITALKETEQRLERARIAAEAANHTKSQFLANMSHEIRTPLGAIMGFASLLKDPSLSREQHESFVDVIERNSSQLLRIIDDILDLSKVEAGMLTVEHIDFSLPELLTDFSSLMGLKAREKGIGFSSRAVTALPKIVNSDPTRLRQILMNVVGNALKFTDQGSVELRCCFEDGLLKFEIEDSGRGISTEEATHLFQPFSQADSSITRKYGGTGLGLALTRNLSEALGGKFELLRSEPKKGSVFQVEVQVSTAPNVEFVSGLGFQTVPPKTVAALGELADMKVLLVEDSPDNQALISIYLGRAGASTDIASDGAQGVQMAQTKNYDIVLMDVQMPVMDGITAVRHLRQSGYRKPIVALTAHAMREERVRCLDAGFDEFLSKPVTRKDLISLLIPHKIRR